jgi:hypothetical protein
MRDKLGAAPGCGLRDWEFLARVSIYTDVSKPHERSVLYYVVTEGPSTLRHDEGNIPACSEASTNRQATRPVDARSTPDASHTPRLKDPPARSVLLGPVSHTPL